MDKVQELVDLLKENKREERPNVFVWALGIVIAICAIAAVTYAVYRYFTPDYLKDFDDEDFEDDFDAYFEDDDVRIAPTKEVKEKLEEVKKDIAEKAEEVVEKAGEVKDAVSEKAAEIKEEVTEKAEEIKEEVTEKVEEIKEEITGE